MCIDKNNSEYIDLLKFIIPFLLGLFSSLVIDEIRKGIRRKKNKKFIVFYFKEHFLPSLPNLIIDYDIVKDKIANSSQRNNTKISAYEGFHTQVLNAIKPQEYYKSFKRKYIEIAEIISMIDFINEFLPANLYAEYWNIINNHLKEKGIVGDKEHVLNCPFCQQQRDVYYSIIENRKAEIKTLIENINKIVT